MNGPEKSNQKAAQTAGRREFFKGVGLSGLLAATTAFGGAMESPPLSTSPVADPVKIPSHLPPRLTITLWIRGWLMAVNPGEPYFDLDQAFSETVERGYNTIRPEVALNWCFDQQGRPRGPIDVKPWVAGLSDNFRGYNGRAGVRYDALERVLRMYELAKKYNVRVIQTSWEYQDSTPMLADPKLRADVMSTPLAERFERLANMHDRLIQELKGRGLEKQIAFVEIHNELNASDFPAGYVAQKPLVEKALRRLQKAHPDVLFTAEYVNAGPCFEKDFPGYDALPENLQVADHHIYTLGVQQALLEALGVPQWNEMPPDLKSNALLRWLIGENPKVSWEEWTRRAALIPKGWLPIQWLTLNITEPDRYDYWMFEHFGEYAAVMKMLIQASMREWGNFARQRGIPVVIDEGYIFWPPGNSRFEESGAVRHLLEVVVDTAIEQKYWGMMNTALAAPGEPVWKESPEWLKKTNQRFLNAPL
jgi:Sugar-binding cellulase-like